jgi:hypothetical protein
VFCLRARRLVERFTQRKKQRNKRLFGGRRMNRRQYNLVVTAMSMLRNKRFRQRLLVLKRRYIRGC